MPVGVFGAAAHQIATWSISWNTCRPNWLTGLEPPRATTGAAVDQRVGEAGDRLMTPGPLAAMQTRASAVSRL